MEKNLKVLVVLTALVFCLCLVVGYVKPANADPSTVPAKEESTEQSSELGTRVGPEVNIYKIHLGDKIQTTPVHPSDSGFLRGATTTAISNGTDFGLKGGVWKKFANKKGGFNFTLGLDARINLASLADYHGGIFEVRQQRSDIRPGENGSFVYTQLKPGLLTFIPYAGIGYEIKNFNFVLEFGLPQTQFTASSGHDRFGRWEEVQSSNWSGWGQRYGLKVIFSPRLDSGSNLCLSVSKEKYKPIFLDEQADIDSVTIGLMWERRF
jgi:hypothetical protein